MLRSLLRLSVTLSLAACSGSVSSVNTDVPAADVASDTVDVQVAVDVPVAMDVPVTVDVPATTDVPVAMDVPGRDVVVSDVRDVTVSDALDVVASDARDVAVSDVITADVRDAGAATGCDASMRRCVVEGVDTCVDTQSDPRHCGACGRVCCPGQWCAVGMCVGDCPPGNTPCIAPGTSCPICYDLRVDSANCGACNHACAAGQHCESGACVATVCPPVTEPDPPMGVCDGRGRIACQMWAQTISGGNPNATATCLTSPSSCARADQCADLRDPSTCRCGAEPACAPGSVCVLTGPTARCQCARTP